MPSVHQNVQDNAICPLRSTCSRIRLVINEWPTLLSVSACAGPRAATEPRYGALSPNRGTGRCAGKAEDAGGLAKCDAKDLGARLLFNPIHMSSDPIVRTSSQGKENYTWNTEEE